jgi:SAM-dependent methyltransferase
MRTAMDVWGCRQCSSALVPQSELLACPRCLATYPLVGDVPVFVPEALAQPVTHERDLGTYRGYTPWLPRVVLQSLLDSQVALELGCGNQEFDDPNIIRTDVLLHPFVDAVADVHTLPVQDESVDFVFSGAVFEHLRDPFAAVREIHRVLKPGGYVYADWNFVFAYHGYPHHYFNASLQGIRQAFGAFRELRAGVAPFQGPGYAVRQVLETYLDGLPNDRLMDRELRRSVELVLGFPLADVDTRMTTRAIERTAAGVYFFGVKQDTAGDSIIPAAVLDAHRRSSTLQTRFPQPLDVSLPDNLLRWSRDEGRAAEPAIADALDALPRFVKHGDAERAGRDELRRWPVSMMAAPHLTDHDRTVIDMFQRRERSLLSKIAETVRENPLALPGRVARYLRWTAMKRRGESL